AVWNTGLYIMDERGQLLPDGVAGELCVGGAQVARGYWDRPELTALQFVKDPFTGGRMYRTGDQARWLPDGNLAYLGRRDGQVKIRGYRVELGEIERVLGSCEGVLQCVVVAGEEGGMGDKVLVGYVVVEGELEVERLRAMMLRELPEYMVPGILVRLAELPLTASGKVDRKGLPDPEAWGPLKDGYMAPGTALEKTLAEIWQQLLQVGRVGIYDNFFQLGGHSLIAIQLVSKISKELGVKIEISIIFLHPTIRQLAQWIDNGASDSQGFTDILPMKEQPYYDLSQAQKGQWLMYRYEKKQGAFNCVINKRIGDVNGYAIRQACMELVRRHESLRSIFVDIDGGKQIVKPFDEFPIPFQVIDISAQTDVQEKLQEYISSANRHLFNFTEGPLFYIQLIKLHEGDHYIIFNMHHVVCDEWSKNVIERELMTLYRIFLQGLPNDLPPVKVQFRDYVHWNKQLVRAALKDDFLRYWHRFSKEKLPARDLLTSRRPELAPVLRRPYREILSHEIGECLKPMSREEESRFFGVIGKVVMHESSTYYFTIAPLMYAELKQLSKDCNTSLFAVLVFFLNLWARGLTGCNDMIVAANVVLRDHESLAGLIGFMVNTVLIRNSVDETLPLRDGIRALSKDILHAYKYQYYPFEQILDDLDISFSAISRIFLNMPSSPDNHLELLQDLGPRHYANTGSGYFDLDLHITEYSNGIGIYCNYKTIYYQPEDIEWIFSHFINTIDSCLCLRTQPEPEHL
ncbi:condensation domain-containing protein, partial [Flavitalea sp. BT771]|uniref:condensation domain-containing protein n=1 Tax=Flavitalea sp. BT771 TaxID=3063329 RepID=UPI0029496EBD